MDNPECLASGEESIKNAEETNRLNDDKLADESEVVKRKRSVSESDQEDSTQPEKKAKTDVFNDDVQDKHQKDKKDTDGDSLTEDTVGDKVTDQAVFSNNKEHEEAKVKEDEDKNSGEDSENDLNAKVEESENKDEQKVENLEDISEKKTELTSNLSIENSDVKNEESEKPAIKKGVEPCEIKEEDEHDDVKKEQSDTSDVKEEGEKPLEVKMEVTEPYTDVKEEVKSDITVKSLSSDNGTVGQQSGQVKEEKESSENSATVKIRERKRRMPEMVSVNGVSDLANNSETSSLKSEDSEKENRSVDVDAPMDLSKKPTSNGGPLTNGGPDVIMLSDSDEEMMNGDSRFKEPSLDEILRRRKLIKRFQSDLRNEEAKLVLLKKLRQSQLGTGNHQVPDHPSVNNKQSSSSSSSSYSSSKRDHSSQPPPLVRGSQNQQQHQQQAQAQARPAHSQPPQLMRGGNQAQQSSRAHQGPPPLVNMGGQRVDNRRMPHMGYNGGIPGSSSSNHMSNYRQGSQSAQAHAQAQAQQQIDNQTPAQRQAAAKMALRKQLEKTLLQIPPPKPPPPEMNFVPSLSSPDFISLLGLEEAVNYIIDATLISKGQKNPDEKMVCNPFTCVQCNTDFTPVWKREKAGSKNVICENCVTTNQKKALKQEHTNRLKSAFVKALQQEQEIERMQSQSVSSSGTTSSSTSQQQQSSASSNNSSLMNNTQSSHQSSPSMSSSAYRATSETLRQHQNLLQAHQAAAAHQTALRMGQPLGLAPFAAAARGAFPYQLPFGAKPDLQLQRQYLLDMIPNPGRGSMSWKQ